MSVAQTERSSSKPSKTRFERQYSAKNPPQHSRPSGSHVLELLEEHVSYLIRSPIGAHAKTSKNSKNTSEEILPLVECS